MKRLLHRLAGRRSFGLGAPLTITLLLAAVAAKAQTPFTATGWVNQVLAPGIVSVTPLGQVLIHGNVHTARVQSPDPHVTGQAFIISEGGFNADGTASLQGPVYLQVGTWDAAGTNFTPSGAMWDATWRGVMQTNYSLLLNIAGYGIGGSIDGQRLEATFTRGPATNSIDFGVPYLYTGTLKPPPLNTTELVNDFCGPFTNAVFGKGTCFNSNCQFYAVGNLPTPTYYFDTYVFGAAWGTSWTVTNGTTREWRADLVRLDDNATNIAQLVVSGSSYAGYAFFKARDFACLVKWSSLSGDSVLWCEKTTVPLPHTNVILAVALTRQAPNLVITTRVLDKADPNKVLFAHSYRDTPASDPTLTSSQFQALTGMLIHNLAPDAVEPPPTAVGACLGLFQYTDGHQPVPTAVFDNLEMRTSEIPPLGIEPAVRVSWPALDAINYAIESAPTVLGPWQPVQDSTIPGMNQMTVPANRWMQFFQAVQAP